MHTSALAASPHDTAPWARARRSASPAVALGLVLAMLVSGCAGGGQTATPTPTPQAVVPTPQATPALPPAPPTATALPTDLFLDVSAPANETVMNTALAVVRGRTTPDAVVSINGETVVVDAVGTFTADVLLDDGPNVIQVVASTLTATKQVSLAVIFIP